MRIPQIGRRVLAPILVASACTALFDSPSLFARPQVSPGSVPPGAVTALVLPVAGMTCALCTRGVEASVKLLENVVGATADLSTGRVRVQAAEGKSLVIREVIERVHKAGFRIGGECRVEAVGRFSLGPDRRLTFRIPGTAYSFQVLEGNELRRLFRGDPGLKGEFLVDFRLHDHARWKPAAISIVRAESRAAAAPVAGR